MVRRLFLDTTYDRVCTGARALVDRIAFVVESFAVGVVVLGFLGLAALRFDVLGAAYVWGRFWTRFAAVDEAARVPVTLALLIALGAATGLCAFVRWDKARRAFDGFPVSTRDHAAMLERLK